MASRKKSSEKDNQLRRALYSAARSLNWFLPQTEEEVVASEDAIEPIDSSSTGDPFEALDRDPSFSKRPPPEVHTAPEYEQEFKRAARLGKGNVPEEIEERMRRDRERAERENSGS